LERAQQALRAAGYVRKKVREDDAFVYFHPARPPRTPESRDDLYSPSFHRTVELRDHVWNANQERVPFALPQGFLDRASPRTWGSLRFCSLSAEDLLLVQVLHAFRHILHNWCRLSWLLEIAYFLEQRSQDSAFWGQFCKRIQAHRPLPQIAGVVFSLAADLFGAAIPPSLSNATIQTLPTSLTLWVSRYGLNSALDNFSGNKFSLFLHREFIQDDAAWQELRRSRLFPLKWPNHAARACDPRFSSRLAVGWKQGLYVAHRLLHHLTAGARYGWESVRWERVRLRGW
jgi:hypothetical protein